jgi:hypothetical protein
VSDPIRIVKKLNERSIPAFSVNPRAFGAPQSGSWGFFSALAPSDVGL